MIASYLQAGLRCVLTLVILVGACSQLTRAEEPPPSFTNEVMAVLSKAGCNAGTCHGNQNGKGGFKLSLRGQDPAADFLALTRDQFGRRINAFDPEQSLILAQTVDAGAARRRTAAQAGLAELRAPAALDRRRHARPTRAHIAVLGSIDVEPASRCLSSRKRRSRFASVHASLATKQRSQRARRDASWPCMNRPARIVSVTPEGLVRFKEFGEATVIVRYLNLQTPVRLAYIPARPDFVWSDPPPANYIDEHVFAKLRSLRINPSERSSDSEFIRRAYLDALGILPTADEARRFVADTAADKRDAADRSAARAARVRRTLGDEMVRPAQERREGHRPHGREAVPRVDSRQLCRQQAARSVRPRAGRRPRQHVREPAGQLLPGQPRRRLPRRGDRPGVSRRAAGVRQVSQPSRSTAGRRTTTTAGRRCSLASITRSSRTTGPTTTTSTSSTASRSSRSRRRARSKNPRTQQAGQPAVPWRAPSFRRRRSATTAWRRWPTGSRRRKTSCSSARRSIASGITCWAAGWSSRSTTFAPPIRPSTRRCSTRSAEDFVEQRLRRAASGAHDHDARERISSRPSRTRRTRDDEVNFSRAIVKRLPAEQLLDAPDAGHRRVARSSSTAKPASAPGRRRRGRVSAASNGRAAPARTASRHGKRRGEVPQAVRQAAAAVDLRMRALDRCDAWRRRFSS